jgi:hypothetical protein
MRIRRSDGRFIETPHASLDPCPKDAGQARLHHGGQRRGRDLPPARRPLQPGGAVSARARPARGGDDRAVPRQQPALPRDLLGRASGGADLHGHKLPGDRRGGGLHPERQWRAALPHVGDEGAAVRGASPAFAQRRSMGLGRWPDRGHAVLGGRHRVDACRAHR